MSEKKSDIATVEIHSCTSKIHIMDTNKPIIECETKKKLNRSLWNSRSR